MDTAAPAAPTGALSNESQVRQSGGGLQTYQQTPSFGGTYDAGEPGGVLVFRIQSLVDGVYKAQSWRSSDSGSPFELNAEAGRWQLKIPASAKLPIQPAGIDYQA